jgi:hypothetical protein
MVPRFEDDLAVGEVGPIDEENLHRRAIPHARAQIGGGQGLAIDGAFDVEIVHCKIGDGMNGRARVTGARLIQKAFHRQILVKIREAERSTRRGA